MQYKEKINEAIFAAGCFWGVQETFRKIRGVNSTIVGYTGGITSNPTYEEVCRDQTGHAEAILIDYDVKLISYTSLLDIFWKIHDPTTLNQQGLDVGSQYRSAIFYKNDQQMNESINSLDIYSKKFKNKIVTEIKKADKFYIAEEYHQNYIQKQNI